MSSEPGSGVRGDFAPLDRFSSVLWAGVGAGLVALGMSHSVAWLSAIGIGTLIFLSAFACGCLLGFLFGVPRVLSRERNGANPIPPAQQVGGAIATGSGSMAAPSAGVSPSETVARPGADLLQSNTNLERISDWLTTMLVGATLVQLYKINDGLVMFRDFLRENARIFPDGVHGFNAGVLPVVGPILLIFGMVCGFIYMYLNTRLVLIRLFYSTEIIVRGIAEQLPASDQAAVRSIVNSRATSNPASFVTQQIFDKRNLTIQDALNLMFDGLYKEMPDDVIKIGASISNSDAIKRAEYWFYLTAAFGQKLSKLTPEDGEWTSTSPSYSRRCRKWGGGRSVTD